MTKRLKAPSNVPGVCCTCAQQVDACHCVDNQCSLACQAKTVIASLCGWSEFGSPSTPPKKYRVLRYDGRRKTCDYLQSLNCIPGDPSTGNDDPIVNQRTWTGHCDYDSATCAIDNQTLYNNSDPHPGIPCESTVTMLPHGTFTCGADAASAPDTSLGGWVLAPTVTKTTKQWVSRPDCYVIGNFINQSSRRETDTSGYAGFFNMSLDTEDTESTALDRANASLDWTGSNCSADPAFWTIRTTGFSFSVRTVQVRATAGISPQPPLIIGHDYELTVGFYRRLLGSSGPFVFTGIDTISIHADHTSEVTPWLDVPNEPGWETRAQSCKLVDVTVNAQPSIVEQSTSMTVARLAHVTLLVAAVGQPSPTYQWLKNGVAMPFETHATLDLIGVTSADSGSYTVIATNSHGSTTSTPIALVVLP